jgi:hypothetical protein
MDPEQRQAYNADLDRSLQDEDDGYTGELLSRWCANTRMGKNEDPEESRGVFVVRGRRGAALLYPRLGRGWQAWPGREAWAEDTALRRFPFQPPPPPPPAPPAPVPGRGVVHRVQAVRVVRPRHLPHGGRVRAVARVWALAGQGGRHPGGRAGRRPGGPARVRCRHTHLPAYA